MNNLYSQKRISNSILIIVVFCLLILVSWISMLIQAPSMKAGLMFGMVVFAYILLHIGKYNHMTIKRGYLLVVVGAFMLILVQYLISRSIFEGSMDLRFILSYILLGIVLIMSTQFVNIIKLVDDYYIKKTMFLVFRFLLTIGIIALILNYFGFLTGKNMILFKEPSHFALVYLPLLLFAVYSSKKPTGIFYLLISFLLAIFIENLTLLAGIVIVSLILFRGKKFIFIVAIIFATFFITGITVPDYFMSRITLSFDSKNLSVLTFLSGYERAYLSFVESFGFGVGFNQFGIVGPIGNAMHSIITLMGGQTLTLRDGASLAPKVIAELGLLGIDEAHHSTAKTWDDAISYFSEAKIIKLTGTPFRTDGQKIEGELVYNYKLGLAMARRYIKSLENISYIPDELYLTIDENESIQYTVQQIYDLGLKDEDWVTRSVAFSMECSERVVDRSIEFLHRKKNTSNIPHKIIAVACSIFHANQIKSLYESKGLKVAIIHSKLEQKDIEKAFSDIENNRVEVVVNVAMLGEGYDHPYLSVAAIFRPFKVELPYIQFIGRILRYIDDENATPIDNVGQIISHKNLELDDLWRKYKKEIDESEIIKRLINDQDIDDLWEDDNENLFNEKDSNGKVIQFGQAYEYGQGTIVGDSYIDTELLKKAKAIEKEEQKKINELIKLLGVTELQARTIVISTSNTDLSYNAKHVF